jgi:hypothetical protein
MLSNYLRLSSFSFIFHFLFTQLICIDAQCYNYTLDNECSFVVGSSVETSPEYQEDLFSSFALNVSDIRMVPSICRRTVLWFYCNLIFKGYCEDDDFDNLGVSESSGCIPNRYSCDQMNDDCSVGIVNCDLLYTFISNETRRCETEDLEISVSNSIAVSTCLESQNMSIECCPSPFHQHSKTKECVLQCKPPIGIFFEEDQKLISIVSMALSIVGLVVIIIGIFPLFFSNQLFEFPRYVIILVCLSLSISFFELNISIFVGRKEFLCGDEEDFAVATDELIRDRSCQTVMGLYVLLSLTGFCWYLVLSLVCFSYVFGNRYRFLSYLSPLHPQNTAVQIGIWVIILTILVFEVLFNVINSISNPQDYIVFHPTVYSCLPNILETGYYSYIIPLIIIGAISGPITVISMVSVMCRSFTLFILNWRAFVSLLNLFFVYILFVGMSAYVYPYNFKNPLIDYAECVANHPRNTTECDIDNFDPNPFWLEFLFYTYLPFTSILVSFVTLWSQPYLIFWWSTVLTQCRIPQSIEFGSIQTNSKPNT